jgi:ABC-2 type transport system ATP-binding protein
MSRPGPGTDDAAPAAFGFRHGSGLLPLLQVADLHKSYGSLRAVAGVNFHIEPGEIFGLLGPNGAGKSTTINIIAALIRPDGGRVCIDGVVCCASAAYKRRLGYVPQEISLAEKLTARENLHLIGQLYDLRGRGLRERVDRTLHAVGLAERADDFVSAFSGGMKRRLNIAGALLHEPELLLLDEPTAGVDPQARACIFEIIERLASEGRAVLYTTHYMEEAQRLCRRIAIIDHGKILTAGTLAELTRANCARQDLMIRADALTGDMISRLSKALGNVSWTLEDNVAHLTVGYLAFSLVEAVRAADELGIKPTAISINEPTLETVFLEMTGRALRD